MNPSPLELRVLTGPQAGARIALAAGGRVDVGSLDAAGCQVVLRDPRVAQQRVRLHVRPYDVRLEVLAGEVEFNGMLLVAPAFADWPLYAPVRLGDTVLAVGAEDGVRWDDALALALSPQPPAAPAEAPAPEAPAPAVVPRPRRRLEAWLAIGGGALALVATGLLAFASLVTPPKVVAESPSQRLERLLAVPEFRGLRVAAAGEGLRVTGDVLTFADRQRLDAQLAGADLSPVVEVRVAEQLAAAVREVFRMNGVVAETTPATSLADVGVVRVATRVADLSQLARAEASARRDVPGLRGLAVENERPAAPPDNAPVADDPGKRVASIVPGDSPYVVTVDGTRYFVGALLPSGHRLASITEQEVLLDKDGVISTLRF
ncbi:SctD/MshK family protein [Piscinibacter gummiphilus]|uniref:YscD/Y4YQ C-terminal domain-containing protein n=1 Tax=Piscinibacter gummiphilus TaxID=946333 RepID=A0A1W6LH41_9BURK|nr:hypothetical protein [Piscinibacter gummiphilus]ARN23538.1 hypothetical protein A4W93_28615 [Piscinibacter gummiphilus]ATU68247.1 hypothetical protein CPZ87_28750 [Piscinibacter gummiphilus]GLS97574.1 hypothetical protein GCM10007918_48660 [Piscinibacter gummiphilus]